MNQRTLAMTTGFERYSKKTRRAAFLEEMELVVPWSELCALVDPHYPKPGNGRSPVGIHAANLLSAAVVQPLRPRAGRSPV